MSQLNDLLKTVGISTTIPTIADATILRHSLCRFPENGVHLLNKYLCVEILLNKCLGIIGVRVLKLVEVEGVGPKH